jgi:Tol biopolymer transport system component
MVTGCVEAEETLHGTRQSYTSIPPTNESFDLSTPVPTLTPPPSEGEPSKIAFTSERDGNWEVYLMNTDGSNIVNLSNNPAAADIVPKWSPDGSHLAFTSSGSVAIVNLEGKIVGKFAPEAHLASNPSWSPSGKYVAFNSTIDDNFEIYTMSHTGNNLNRLTNDPLHDDSCPEWSPDGEFIAFASHAKMQAGFSLHIMRSDGTDVSGSLGTWAGTTSSCPLIDWSPDGKYLAAISRNLYVQAKEPLDEAQIIAECANGYPDWSPDGTKIVFTGDECTNNPDKSEIYVVNADGTNLVRLTTNSDFDLRPVWSPDGEKIAFVSLRDGNLEIYIMNADGSQQTNLTQNAANDDWPVWQP